MTENKNRIKMVLIDRDGTLIVNKHYLDNPEDIEFYPGVINSIKKLNSAGIKVVVITNQSGIGRGLFSLTTLQKIHDEMILQIESGGAKIDSIFFCPHKPEDGCECRKPNIGMMVEASVMFGIDLSHATIIGDSEADIKAGTRAGCTPILVLTGYGEETNKKMAVKQVFPTLNEAIKSILEE
jgi:D-glycero-D-manno-heptose 1,7-bisphosphate phosphatase